MPPSPTTTPEAAPNKAAARSAFSRGLREGTDKAKAELKKKYNAALSAARESEMTGELVTIGGGVAAGAMDRAGLEMVVMDKYKVPTSAPVGLAAYIGGRWTKSPIIRKAGVGLMTGAAALFTSRAEW